MINLSGAGLLGLLAGLAPSHDEALLAGTAAVGSYTTWHRRRGTGPAAREPGVIEDCLKLTTYFGERHRSGWALLADAQLDLFGRQEIATSILLRGAEGFGLNHHSPTALSEDLPVVSVAVDTRHRIETLLDDLQVIEHHGLVTLKQVRMLRGGISPLRLPDEPRGAARTASTRHRTRRELLVSVTVEVVRRRRRSGGGAR